MPQKKLSSRLAVAQWAVSSLAPRVRSTGMHQAAQPHCPAYWQLDEAGCRMMLAVNALRLPDDPESSALLDVWMDHGGKVMSVSWFPSLPWRPPHISTLKAGDWLYRLGWRESVRNTRKSSH